MKKLIASVLVAAIFLGAVARPANAASPASSQVQVTEGNHRPNTGPGHNLPGTVRPGQPQAVKQPARPAPQPARPTAPQPKPMQPRHKPLPPRNSHRPAVRPGNHHGSSSSGVGLGIVIGAVLGSVLTHTAHR